jgi:hypothetical protein
MELYVTAYNVDLLDLIDNLDEKQSGLLFDYLAQKQTANEEEPQNMVARPKILIDHEFFVDINVYDMCNELGDWEIDEIIDYLERYGHLDNLNDDSEDSPSTPEDIFGLGYRPLEQELGMMLNQLWESRDYLSADQKARIEAITKESYI